MSSKWERTPKPERRKNLTEEQRVQIIKLRELGHSTHIIGGIVGITAQSVATFLKKHTDFKRLPNNFHV